MCVCVCVCVVAVDFDLSVLSESIGALPHTPPEGLLAVSPLSLLLTVRRFTFFLFSCGHFRPPYSDPFLFFD